MSIADQIRSRINIIKETSGTGTTLSSLQAAGPIDQRVRVNIESRNKANTSTVRVTTPTVIEEGAGSGLLLGGAGLVWDFWSLLLGTGEEKAETIGSYLPIETVSGPTFEDVATSQITEEYGEGNILVNPITGTATPVDLPKLPSFGDIGKWLLIGGAALAGVYLLGKFLGRGRK